MQPEGLAYQTLDPVPSDRKQRYLPGNGKSEARSTKPIVLEQDNKEWSLVTSCMPKDIRKFALADDPVPLGECSMHETGLTSTTERIRRSNVRVHGHGVR